MGLSIMKLRKAFHTFLYLFISIPILYADYTGDVLLTDSEYNDIGEEYPAGTETIYVQVYDSDVTGSLDVVLTSTTDTEGETVTLTEVSDLPGTFRGAIPTGSVSNVLVNEDLLEDRVAQLRVEYPDHTIEALRSRARGQLAEEAINNPPATLSLRSDGVLQATAGDLIIVTYDDVLNDYGNAETLVTTAVYGGWSGDVSGLTWTAAGSPYVVTGDIYVNGGSSLTIESGVDVRFYGDYYLYLNGALIAQGAENDSIYFRNHTDDVSSFN